MQNINELKHRIKAQYDYRDIAVVVLNDGVEVVERNNKKCRIYAA